jgi:4-hydroxythreonine-4-phosphate dehydrogenase
MLANHAMAASITIVVDQNALLARGKLLGLTLDILQPQNPPLPHLGNGKLTVMHVPVAETVIAGELNQANAHYVLQTLICAADGCMQGKFNAMVTAPVHKGIINDAGIAFIGHTEFLAEHTGTEQVVMMLIGGGMRVALATTHLPLNEVSGAITQQNLEATLRILHQDLVQRFGIKNPRILVAGLNPHAGESGYLGREEITVITPVLEKLHAEGMNLVGPLPAGTLFTPRHLAGADCVLAMYHDQGLPVLKHASFGGGVNVTLGLPIIRTSVDHGTALDLVGTGKADAGNLYAASELAIEFSKIKPLASNP